MVKIINCSPNGLKPIFFAPVLLLALALPISFTPMQANVFMSTAYAFDLSDLPVPGCDSLAGYCADYPSDDKYCQPGTSAPELEGLHRESIDNLRPEIQGPNAPGIINQDTISYQHTESF